MAHFRIKILGTGRAYDPSFLVDSLEAVEQMRQSEFLSHPELYDPNVCSFIYEDVSSEIQSLEIKKQAIESRNFLQQTDYVVIKCVENGDQIPTELKQQRAAARLNAQIVQDNPTLPIAIQATQEQLNAKRWNDIRKERNKLLLACDWTQLADAPFAPEQKQRWRNYRQALRDVPQNIFDIVEAVIVWPKSPDEEDAELQQ